ncbi:MAG: DNA polymerase III subunit beta [Paludibacteraceae bacterium]|nr:DNA polymerase III subunit beta [Paludibacteraceae bacterium]
MTINISSSVLLNSMLLTNRVIVPNNVMPILENVLFKIEGSKLTIMGTNLENTIITDTEINDTGVNLSIALPAKLITETLRSFPEQNIEIEINEENMEVVIKSSTGKYNFVGIKGDGYPENINLNEDMRHLSLPTNLLYTGVSNTVISTSVDARRPTMTGVFVDLQEDKIIFAATDAHKLTKNSYSSIKTDDPCSFIMPKKTALLIKGMMSSNDTKEVDVSFNEKNIIIKTDDFIMISKQIEGKYPNYNAVIPKDNPYELIIDRELLNSAIRRLMVYANPATCLIKMTVNDNSMELKAQDIDTSRSGMETMTCQYNGEEMMIGFRATQVADVLANIDSQNVRIKLGDSSRAAIFMPNEIKEGEDLLHLVMPMLIK